MWILVIVRHYTASSNQKIRWKLRSSACDKASFIVKILRNTLLNMFLETVERASTIFFKICCVWTANINVSFRMLYWWKWQASIRGTRRSVIWHCLTGHFPFLLAAINYPSVWQLLSCIKQPPTLHQLLERVYTHHMYIVLRLKFPRQKDWTSHSNNITNWMFMAQIK
jgi:hypothetical protein